MKSEQLLGEIIGIVREKVPKVHHRYYYAGVYRFSCYVLLFLFFFFL